MEEQKAAPLDEVKYGAKNPFWGFWATTGLGIIVVVASFIAQGMSVVAFMVNYLLSHHRAGLTAAIDASFGAIVAAATVLEVLLCFPLIAVFIRLRRSLSLNEYLGLRGFKVKTLLFWLAVNFMYLLIAEGIRVAFEIPQSQNDARLYSTSLSLPLFFVAIVVFAPAFEEVLFRGFMFRGYAASRAGPVLAIVITAAMWALLHVSAGGYDFAVIFTGGLVLGLARWKTGSVWITFAMHAFWNALAFITLAAASSS